MKETILVTGGAGFIGSHLVDRLVALGYPVKIFDNLAPQVHQHGVPSYLNPHAEFIQGDVRDYAAFKNAIQGSDIIFHFAAAVGVGQAQYQIKHYVDVNEGGTANLLDIVVNEKTRVKKIIIAASMSSYGEGIYHCSQCGAVHPSLRDEKKLAQGDWKNYCPHCNNAVTPKPTPETAPLASCAIYAITKKNQEELSLSTGWTYQLPVVSMRFFNVYGPRQSLSNPYTGVAAIFMSRLKNNQHPVVYEDGKQSRDFISVHDIVRANIAVMQDHRADYQSFNIGTGNASSIEDIGTTLARLMKKDISPEITNTFRKGDIRHCFADISKINQAIGFSPQTTLTDGLQELVQWADKETAVDLFLEATAQLQAKGLLTGIS